MPEMNYAAILVAAIAAFFASFLWYVLLGKELAAVSKAFAELQSEKPQPWRMLVVLAGSLVLSSVVAYLIGIQETTTWAHAMVIGFLLWLGLSAVQWASSIVWEKVPIKMAAIHAGDWLMKLLVISAIVGAWR